MSVYTVPFDNLSVTNDSDQDIWEILAPSDAAVELVHFELYSAVTTDERVRLRLVRRSTAGSGGAGATEVPARGTLAAVGTAVTQLNTTPGTAGDVLCIPSPLIISRSRTTRTRIFGKSSRPQMRR